jgi:hypothetical protein
MTSGHSRATSPVAIEERPVAIEELFDTPEPDNIAFINWVNSADQSDADGTAILVPA